MKLGLDQIRERFIKAGLKATHQRMVVYQALCASKSHPSSDWIYDQVQPEIPSITLATVYNVLDSLVDAGLAKRVMSSKGSMRYDGRVDHHHHLVCSNTQEIMDFYDEELNQIILNYIKDKKIENFEYRDMQLQIRGEKLDPKKKVKINL